MFAKVIPAVKLPRTLRAFDYAIPDEYRDFVKRGSWIVVPWRGRPVDGLVIKANEKPEIDAKSIKEILGLGDLHALGEDLTRLPEWMAARYFVAPATALKAFLPRTPKTLVVRELESEKVRESESYNRKKQRSVIRYASPSEKLEETVRVIQKTIEESRSAVIVTPHVGEVDDIAAKLERKFKEIPIIRVSGRTADAKLRRAWGDILAREQVIVVGGRPAVFAPIRNPGLFLLLESDSGDLRQYDQNPRYDAREVARFRAEHSGADVVFMSHAPRLEEYAKVKAGEFDYTESLGAKELRSLGASLVDVSGNPLGRDNPLSPVAVERIRDSLHQGKKVLMFLNRKGSAGALACADCGQVFRCDRCGIAESFTDETLHCRRCDTKRQAPDRCAKCGGTTLRPVGMGTTSVADALDRMFPDARVCRHDSESVPSDGSGALPGDADIYVGTRLLLHDAAENDYEGTDWGCVVAVDTDGLLAHPGFRVMEDAWRAVRLMRDIAASSGADLLLQTVDPESSKIRRLLADTDAFMRVEAESRFKSSYPPSGNLITVTIREDDENRAERRAREFKMEAERSLIGSGTSVAGPLKPKRPFRDGTYRRVVAIKTPKAIPQKVGELLNSLPEDHIIDRNPETI
ncbi:MAG: hypothetical protein U9Q03_03545 [Patescibacteria group bacterium]|nr:hypothetical protein [Patescibacteria group bacterium]